MDRSTFRQLLTQKIFVIDGAMGTMLQAHLPSDYCMEKANLEKQDLILSVHAAYAEAGADIITTNTFGGSRIKLNTYSLASQAREINFAAAQIARRAANGKALVAGCIGPTGKLVEPLGDLSFDEAYEAFKEQAESLAEGGADVFLLETFADLREIKAAIMAARDAADLPIMASMTFEDNFKTFTGTDPETAAVVLAGLDVDAIGVNCSTGPEPMLEAAGRYMQAADKPIFVEPNAGLPRLEDTGEKAAYLIKPEDLAGFAGKFADIGVNLVGSCCGSSPEYTRAIKQAVNSKKPVQRQIEPGLRLASRVKTVLIGENMPFCIIGERINPTNRQDLIDSLSASKIGAVQDEAGKQAEEGAHILDVNIGAPGIDETGLMEKVITGVENAVHTPVCIDTTNPLALEAALKACSGKPLINSVNGSTESLEQIIPLAKKYGAGLLCLAVGEKGIPKTPEARLAVLKTIVAHAEKAGIDRNNLICDCLTLTVSAEQKRAEATLRAIQMVKDELKLPTVLGVSNISFGLPERSLINSTFLSMSMAFGLDAAIMNPGDARMMETVRAASVLTVRDRDSRHFVAGYQKKKKKTSKTGQETPVDPSGSIYQAVIMGNRDDIQGLVKSAIESGIKPADINNNMLIPAIEEVGRQYDRKEIFLPQMILAAETMQRAFKTLEPFFAAGERKISGKVLLCTVKGDVHDIGKNIVALFLKNQGFEVIDLGKDVDKTDIISAAVSQKPDIVGLSALMTTTMTAMPEIIQHIRKSGAGCKVIIGGAVVNKSYAQEIGADGYAKDGVSAVELVKSLMA